MGFLTRFMIQHYGLQNYEYARTIIGADGQIHCGEAVVDQEAAEEEGYGDPHLKECFWHSAIQHSVLMTAQKKLFAMRKGYKNDMARWKTYARVLQYGEEGFDTLCDDPNAVGSVVSYIDNGRWGNWFRAPMEQQKALDAKRAAMTDEEWYALAGDDEEFGTDPFNHWCSMVYEASQALPDHIGASQAVAYAEGRAGVANAFQLACKIILNSTYGAMAPPMAIATLPLMEIAASITSRGRHCIQMTSYVHEAQRVPELRERSRAWKANGRKFRSLFEEMGDPEVEVDCSAFLRDPAREVHGPEERADARGNLHTHAGDTDSVMVGWPRAFLDPASTVDDVMDDAHCVSALVNRVMLGVMNIDPEKMSRMTLFHVKKNYVMDIVGEKKLLHKGNAVVKGEHIKFVKRQVGALFDLLMRPSGEVSTSLAIEDAAAIKERLVGFLRELRAELRQVALNEVDVSEFVIHKRLNKLHYDEPPEHAVVAQLTNKRGGHVSAGDRVSYGFVSPEDAARLRGDDNTPEDAIAAEDGEEANEEAAVQREMLAELEQEGGVVGQQGEGEEWRRSRILRTLGETSVLGKARDMVEDIQTIMEQQVPLNVEYYLEKKMGGLLDPLAHILAPVDDYPHESQPQYRYNEDQLKKDCDKVQAWQRKRVKEFLYAPASEEFTKRRRLLYNRMREEEDRKQGQSLQRFFSVMRGTNDSHECAFCHQTYTVSITAQERNRRAALSAAEKAREARESTHVCPDCERHSEGRQRKMANQIAQEEATLARTEVICHACIAKTDFEDIISPDDCRKYSCPVYEERAAARLRIQNATQRATLLRQHVDIAYE